MSPQNQGYLSSSYKSDLSCSPPQTPSPITVSEGQANTSRTPPAASVPEEQVNTPRTPPKRSRDCTDLCTPPPRKIIYSPITPPSVSSVKSAIFQFDDDIDLKRNFGVFHCTECGEYMGPQNPRQLCGKTRCYNKY